MTRRPHRFTLKLSAAPLCLPLLLLALLFAGCPPSDAPRAAFRAAPDRGLAPLSVQFTDRSQPGASAITTWQWTFGDGSTSTERNPTHTYEAPGSYTVSLRVTNAQASHRTERRGFITVLDEEEEEGEGEGEGEGESEGEGEGEGEEEPETVSGRYNPDLGLQLEVDALRLEVPTGALPAPVTLSMRRAVPRDLPDLLPGGLLLAGGLFSPSGVEFATPATIRVGLAMPTIARGLPVLRYDTNRGAWVGTGALANVSEDGLEALFQTQRFSLIGVPEGVPIPEPGDPLPVFVSLDGTGILESDAIESDSAWLSFSATAPSFQLNAFEQRQNDMGQPVFLQVLMHSVLVFVVGNYAVGVIGGLDSFYEVGPSREPLVGVMIMSLHASEVHVRFYTATQERVIHGTVWGMR